MLETRRFFSWRHFDKRSPGDAVLETRSINFDGITFVSHPLCGFMIE